MTSLSEQISGMTESAALTFMSGLSRPRRPREALLDLLGSHWSRRVRTKCGELLGQLNDGRAVEAIIEAAEERRLTQAAAVQILSNMDCGRAVACLVEVADGDRWYWRGDSTRFDYLDRVLAQRVQARAVVYTWRRKGLTKGVRERLADVARTTLLRELRRLDVSEQCRLLEPRKVRRFLIDVRGLPEAYRRVDGREGAVHMLDAGRSYRAIGRKRLDRVGVRALRRTVLSLSWTFRSAFREHREDGAFAKYLVGRGIADVLPAPTRRGQAVERAVPDFANLAGRLGVRQATLNSFFGQSLSLYDRCYRTFSIKKRRRGKREIAEPSAFLKHVQRRIKQRLLDPVELTDSAHGFVKGRSIATNASPHTGKELVVNLDLEDFFPTITDGRAFGLFAAIGLAKHEASLLAQLTTYWGELPQGAPTSPVIANLVCRGLDRRLAGLATSIGATYTRYADDLTLSGAAEIRSALPLVRRIIKEEGFTVAAAKTRLQRRGRRQEVTGLTVNNEVGVPRAVRRRLRAAIHSLRVRGHAEWNGKPLTRRMLNGLLAYVNAVQPDVAKSLRSALPGD